MSPPTPPYPTRDVVNPMPEESRLSQPLQTLDPAAIPLPSSSRRRSSIASAQQLTRQLSTSTATTTASTSTAHSREALVPTTPAATLPSVPNIPRTMLPTNPVPEDADADDDHNAPIMLQPLRSPKDRSDFHSSFESDSIPGTSSSSDSVQVSGSSDALNPVATATHSASQRITLPRNSNLSGQRAVAPPASGSRSHSRQSSTASFSTNPNSRTRPTSGTSTLRTRTRRAHQARSTMASILLSSWTSLPLWTKLRIYFATLYTLAEAALPLAAAVVSQLEPPQEFSPCAGYVRLNVATAFVACGLLVLLPATIRWEVIQREQVRWDRMERDGANNGEEGRDLGERPKLNSVDQMLSLVRSLLNIAHFVLFIVANLQLFRIRPGIQQCPESPAIFSLTLAWIILFYCKMFLPVTLMMLGCLCLPFLLLFATHFNRRYAEQQRLANKMPEATLDKLPVVMYLGTFDPDADAAEVGAEGEAGEAQEQSTRVDAESGGVHVRGEDAQCVICLDEYAADESLYLLPCKHHFHEKCLKDWFELSRLCPMCKRDLVEMANGGSGEGGE